MTSKINSKERSQTIGAQQQELISYWSRRLGRPIDTTVAGWQEELQRVLTLISDFSQPGRLLDLACGDSEWTTLLGQRASVVAFDYSDRVLLNSRQRWQQTEPLSCVRGDIFSLPFRTDSFDRCFCGFWLSLVPSNLVGQFLAELSRVVRTGGRVLFVDALLQNNLRDSNERGRLPATDYYRPEHLRAAIWPFAEDVEVFRTRNFFVIANYVVRAQRS